MRQKRHLLSGNSSHVLFLGSGHVLLLNSRSCFSGGIVEMAITTRGSSRMSWMRRATSARLRSRVTLAVGLRVGLLPSVPGLP